MASEGNNQTRASRRRFLRLGVAGTAALAVGSALAWNLSGYEIPDGVRRRLVALTAKEYLIVKALAARILRRDADDLPTPEELHVASAIDQLVAKLDEGNRTDLKKLLHLLEHGLPWTCARPSRFTRLDGASQDVVLASMMTSRVALLRGAFDSLKSLCVMAYFKDARTWAAIGYDGPLVRRPEEGWIPLRNARRS